jgi:endonuclease/exonuclease/phosphatase (EEP) superfamily protein YafD
MSSSPPVSRLSPSPRPRSIPPPRRLLVGAIAAYPLTVAALDLGGFLPLPGDGPIGLAQVLSAHLSLAGLALVPLAFLPGTRPIRLALLVLAVAAVGRFGSEWWSAPSAVATGPTVDVLTWNLEVGSRPPADTVAFLRRQTARVVALEELTTDVAAVIAADPDLRARYPSQALFGTDDVFGLGVLSADPLSVVVFERGPSRLEAAVNGPAGRIRLLVVHPLPAAIPRGPLGVPIGFDPTTRDAALARISATLDRAIAGEEPVLVLGDLNTSSTEPEFARFTAGLRDAHVEAGIGPGWTYRPSRLEALGIGLIRIDVVLTGPGLRPVAESTRCPPVGDHCAVVATVERE